MVQTFAPIFCLRSETSSIAAFSQNRFQSMAHLAFPIFSVIFLTFFLPYARSQGLTLDECSPGTACVEPRECVDSRTGSECRSVTAPCNCSPPRQISCLSDEACPNGEVCAAGVLSTGDGNSRFFCASETAVDENPNLFRITQSNTGEGGLTFDVCRLNSDCLAPRICVLFSESRTGACIGSPDCLCAPPTFTACQSDRDCVEGEVCGVLGLDICASRKVSNGTTADFPNPTGVANPENVQAILDNQDDEDNPTSTQTPEPDDVPNESEEPGVIVITRQVCVAERHMKGVKGVYETGRHARVLCDAQGSCATLSHVVVHRGKGMLMRRYCDVVGCVEKVMKVNSPAWERGLRVQSWSEGLEFTAFAARYETMAEEVFLRALVRAGL